MHHNTEPRGGLSLLSCNTWSHLGEMRGGDTKNILIMFSLLSLQRTPIHKNRLLGKESDFQWFWGNLRIFCLDVNPQCMEI